MVVREKPSKLSELALRSRREGLTKFLPPLGEVLRSSLMERYLTCGNPNCKCARGERHLKKSYCYTLGEVKVPKVTTSLKTRVLALAEAA